MVAPRISVLHAAFADRQLVRLLLLLALLCSSAAGCASLENPVANGVPVRYLPPELLGESKENLRSIPLTALRQPPPKAYILDAHDVLGIWIEGILGEKGQPPPVRLGETQEQKPAVGFPVPVRADGTIALPLVNPIQVKGLTLEEAQQKIQKVYTADNQILQPGKERVIVTLQRPRQFQVLVIRQDSDANGVTAAAGVGGGGRAVGFVLNTGGGAGLGVRHGTGYALSLPAYENDVLNALARTGGFPGTEAVNEVIIERGTYKPGEEANFSQLGCGLPGLGQDGGDQERRIIRIPLRLKPGQPLNIKPEDIILQTGDIVYIAARGAEVFYTGGLLPPGEYVLPRDSDLDVVEAILRVGGILNSGGLNSANINGLTVGSGIGIPSPTLVTVLRRAPHGGCGQVAIRVDLDRALRDARERLLIVPGDVIMLQERPQEAMTRYFNSAFDFTLIWRALLTSRATGTTTVSVP